MRNKKILLLAICSIVFIIVLGILLVLLISKKPTTSATAQDVVEVTPVTEDVSREDCPNHITPLREGAVVAIKDLHFRIDGELKEQPDDYDTIITYYKEDIIHTLQYFSVADTVDVKAIIIDFINGDYTEYKELLSINESDECVYYSYEILGQTVTLVSDTTTGLYYSIIPVGEEYLLISADTEFYLTEDRITTVLGDPEQTPMVKHTYSTYETQAIANTKALLQESNVGFVATGNYGTTTSNSSVITYTSEADNKTREQMAKYASYKWESDGTSKDTKLSLDLTSAIAKSSQWILSAESVYSWSDNGLKLSGLQATKSSVQFTLKGTVTNLLATERPWVLVIKLLDKDGALLKVEVVDSRSTPLSGCADTEFSILTTSSEDVDINEIKSIQFDIY